MAYFKSIGNRLSSFSVRNTYERQIDSEDSGFLCDLLIKLNVDKATIKAKVPEFWKAINAQVGDIEIDDSGKLKAKAGSLILTWLMTALTRADHLSAACEFAQMVHPLALSSPLFVLLEAANAPGAKLGHDDETRLEHALSDACKALLKQGDKELVMALLRCAPEPFQGPAVAGLLELLPIGGMSGAMADVLASLTKQEVRGQAFALAVAHAREPDSPNKQLGYLDKLVARLGKKHPDIANELACEMAQQAEPKLPNCTRIGYSTGLNNIDALEKLNWDTVLAQVQAALALSGHDKSWVGMGLHFAMLAKGYASLDDLELHVGRLAKQGLELKQLEQLTDEIRSLGQSDDPPKKALAKRLGARLLEAVPYMAKLPNKKAFDALVKRIPEGILDEPLRDRICQVCAGEEEELKKGFRVENVLAAEEIAIDRFPQLDFLGALKNLTSDWPADYHVDLLPHDERFVVISKAFARADVSRDLLIEAAFAAGWKVHDSRVRLWIDAHGDRLTKGSLTPGEYDLAMRELADIPDRMFVMAARTKLESLPKVEKKERKYPWKK